MNARRKNQSGQAGIEFVAIMIVIFFFLFFFLSLAITLIISDYLEYATFMAARTYKAYASTPGKQEEHAQLVFDKYFEKVRGIARPGGPLQFLASDESDNNTQGVIATYNIDLFYLPPIFIPSGVPASTIQLRAEAHLGRDPTFQECQKFFDDFGAKTLGIQNTNLIDQMEDNGC